MLTYFAILCIVHNLCVCKIRYLRSSGMLRSVYRWLSTFRDNLSVSSSRVKKVPDYLTLEDRTDSLSRKSVTTDLSCVTSQKNWHLIWDCYKWNFSEMCRFIIGRVVPDVSKVYCFFIVRVKQCKKLLLSLGEMSVKMKALRYSEKRGTACPVTRRHVP